MVTPKSVKELVSIFSLSVMAVAVWVAVSCAACAAPSAAGPYADVPANHVAAHAISQLKSKGIVSGYSDGTYRGSQPVTRYELAIILERFVKYYDHSTQPLSTSVAPLPASPHWVAKSRQYLAANGYLPADSPIFKNPGNKAVTADQLAQCMSSVYDRIVDRSLPPSENQ